MGEYDHNSDSLWGLHFRRDGAANIVQHLLATSVDFKRFFSRTMVHPTDHISDLFPITLLTCRN